MDHDLQNILNKFTYHFKKVLINAQNLAFAKKHAEIEPLDILVSLAQTKGALGSEVLLKKNINTSLLSDQPTNYSNNLEADPSQLPQPSENSQQVIEKAVIISLKNKHKYIGTEHLLWGLSESQDQELQQLWQKTKTTSQSIQQHLNLILRSTSKFHDITTEEETTEREMENMLDDRQASHGVLDNFVIDLTNKDIQIDIDPVIGRAMEIERLIQILARRTKNNPVLLGDAGVGKTAIIEGLAKRITEGKVPEVLLNKTILNLDLSSLLAGTMYRGEFESRLKQVINEVKNNKNIIIFIDELHNIIGAGSTGGSLDAANILKPALARGHLRCIGATTFEEYKKHVESDKALERRFQPIIIEESSDEETYEILHGLKENYEKFHQVTITDQAIRTAVDLSKKFLADKKLPDKAIDLIDEAAAKFKIKHGKQNLAKKIHELEDQIHTCKNNKKEAIFDENYLEALKYKNQEEELLEKLLHLTALRDKAQQKSIGLIETQDIKEVVAKITGVPLSSITTNEKKRLLNLEKHLGADIFGQEKALTAIADTIRKAKTGLQDQNRPLASFMFLGPSGVGKTETAKQLAKHIFGGSQNLLRIDMSEFSESFNVSKLIGAPAGYVGYKDGNKLTDWIKNKPHSIILFDEVEKAHTDVFNLLLPILEEGELTDSTGRTVNFRHSMIVMTSNIGLDIFNQQASLGFDLKEKDQDKNFADLSQKVLGSLNDYFPPEFLNRLDNIIAFEPIDKSAAKKIINKQINQLQERLLAQKITLEIDNKIINKLLKSEEASQEGARSLKRLVDRQLTNPIAAAILNANKRKIVASYNKDKIIIR
jgi:ATP-dependent Clp protease ATP-binding subunit ClpC